MTALPERAAAAGFEAIVAAHHAEIHRYLSRIAARGGEADDLAQETFLRAYRAWSTFPSDGNPRPWLYRIATNAFRNHLRSERRRRDAHASLRTTRREVDRDGPEAVIAADQARASTEAAIRVLPFKQRLAFTMRKLEELDYDVIGDCLDCSPETARAHVFQALRKLRAALDDGARPARRSKS